MVSETEYHPVIFIPGYKKSFTNIHFRAGKEVMIMPYIAPEVVQEVKRMDLLTYLKNYEPFELVHFSGNTYTTKTHDSLKISNGKWMWWSKGIGGSTIPCSFTSRKADREKTTLTRAIPSSDESGFLPERAWD